MDNFKKCDLHMHSSSCYSRNYDKNSFISRLKNKSTLDVISITDHNVVDVLLYKEIRKQVPDLYLIGGVELNISLDSEIINKYNLYVKNNYFHGIVWFSYNDLDRFWEQLKQLLSSKNIEIDESDIRGTSKRTEGIYFELSAFQEIFKDIDYYLVFHEGKSDRNLSDYLPNTKNGKKYEPNLNYKHNLFYYNNKFAIEGGKKTRPISNYFEKQLDVLLARFFFSDAKELEQIGEKFSWVNFDGEFESLVLPLSDPESRIFTSDDKMDNPQLNKDKYLESIKISMKNSSSKMTNEVELFFSPSLNGIIGSRGSGKSLLGSILANKNVEGYKDYVDHASTLYRIKGKEYQNSSPKAKYLSQSSLLNIYNNGDVKEIDFIKVLCSEMELDSTLKTEKFINSAKLMIQNEKSQIYKMIEDGNYNLDDISFLEKSVNEEFMIPSIEESEFENSEKIAFDFYNNNINLVTKIKANIANLEKIIYPDSNYGETRELSEIMDEFKLGFTKIANELIKFIDETNTKVNELDTENYKIRQMLINSLISLIETENTNSDSTAKSFVESKEKAIKQLDSITSYRTIVQESYDYLDKLTKDLKKETRSGDIKVNDSDVLEISTSIEDANDYFDNISSQLKIQNNEKFNDFMIKILFTYNEVDKLIVNFNGNKYKRQHLTSQKHYIDKYFQNIEDSLTAVKKFSIKLYFNNKELNKYSPGKKSEILLDIFLDRSILSEDYLYIILDQPEDNMDTKTITNKLINRIRQLKLDIQLFVISHSAAVIINGDSDNLIFASEHTDYLSYSYGRIIDEDMKKNIVDTLDGGEKNLKMRLAKYDFKLKENNDD